MLKFVKTTQMALLTFGKMEACAWKNPNNSKCDYIIPIIYK